MIWTVDRIENNIAVIETPNGNVNIELKFLPEDIREGSKITVKTDAAEKETAEKRIKEKLNRLLKE